MSLKAHILWRQLGQAIRIHDILVDEEAAPAALDGVEVFPGSHRLLGRKATIRSRVRTRHDQHSAIRLDYDAIAVHNGVEMIIGHTTESRRADGALHYIGTHYSQSPKVQDSTFRRVDLPDGTTAFISDVVHAKSTGHKPQADVARQIAAAFFDRTGPDCVSKGARETVEKTDTLFGYAAIRISQLTGKNKAEKDAGLSRTVTWRLPEFNCVVAQTFSQIRASKTEEWKTTYGNRLTASAATEPDPAVFTNWLNYDEMKPSDVGRKVAIAQGLTPQTCEMLRT